MSIGYCRDPELKTLFDPKAFFQDDHLDGF